MSHSVEQRPASVLAAHGAQRRQFPFISAALSMHLLRIGTAGLFMAHAVVRVVYPANVTSFGAFLEHAGLPFGVPLVWGITLFELIGGTLLVCDIRTRELAAGFTLLLLIGIVLIHRHFGWFVGEHGTGGSEYSVALILALITLAAADRPRNTRPSSPYRPSAD